MGSCARTAARSGRRTAAPALRAWRSEEAKQASVPAYVVFTDATLVAIAEALPTTERALLAVSGVGRTKLEKYGAAVLALTTSTTPDETFSGDTPTGVIKTIAPDGQLL